MCVSGFYIASASQFMDKISYYWAFNQGTTFDLFCFILLFPYFCCGLCAGNFTVYSTLKMFYCFISISYVQSFSYHEFSQIERCIIICISKHLFTYHTCTVTATMMISQAFVFIFPSTSVLSYATMTLINSIKRQALTWAPHLYFEL